MMDQQGQSDPTDIRGSWEPCRWLYMKTDYFKAFVFYIGGTLYTAAPDLVGVTSRFLQEMGLSDPNILSAERITQAIEGQAETWLDTVMRNNDAQPQWTPSHDEWLEYDRIVLSALGVTDGLDERAREYQKMWDAKLARMEVDLIDGCRETLEELHSRGYKLGIASNRWGSPDALLKRDSIADLFDCIEYTNVPGYKKPSPYMLVRAANELKINPLRIAFVGDMVEYDVAAAVRAGALPVLLTWCHPDEKVNAPAGTVIVKHIKNLLRAVCKEGTSARHRQC